MHGKNSPSGRQGFSMIELMVVVAVIAILAMMAGPALMTLVPYQRARTEARHAATIMQQARLKAANTQRPVRVVLDCSRNDEPCTFITQTAIYHLGAVTGWDQVGSTRHEMHRRVEVELVYAAEDDEGNTIGDGGTTREGLYWAIFMPSSRVFSTPRPFTLYFMAEEFATREYRPGWLLSVHASSGRTTINTATRKQGD